MPKTIPAPPMTAAQREQMLADFAEMEKARNEPLLPELQGYVVEGMFGPSLKHPLIFHVPLIYPGHANEGYRRKKAALEEAEREQAWAECVWLHERPHRTDALIDYVVGRDEDDIPCSLYGVSREVMDLAA